MQIRAMLKTSIARQMPRGVQGRSSQSSMDFIRYLLEVVLQVVEPGLFLVELVNLPASCSQIRNELAMLPNQMLQGGRG